MSSTCSKDLVTPFLMKMLGEMQVLSTNLKCEKQPDGKYLYEYSVEVHPHEEDEDLAALLRSESRSSVGYSTTSDYTSSRSYPTGSTSSRVSGISRSTHPEAECIFMVEVRFILFHRNMNGRAQLRIKDEFPCSATVREVIDHFRIETDGVHRGVFAPRLAYALGRAQSASYPLLDCDLDKSLAELCGTDLDTNTITIIADVTR
ncbi:hypothetical protein Y032_0014g2420 [Ancylostoma ceylanicum]|uniref:Uncharacterized protein n=1 Tax=Ancylostoma ceylanicum TaxID=53326 RepID=A0A016VB76_9BILA|nr:hypothetical protein Y032_0014g2420 [Ancylostoma ceylanicum]